MSTAPIDLAVTDSTIGALQIGTLFSAFLFGVVTLQLITYYQRFKEDKLHLKLLVSAIWVLELAHTFCIAAEVYKATITNYGRPENLFPFKFIGASTATGGGVTFLAHTFFAVRVWRVLPRWWNMIGAVCQVVAAVRFIGSIILAINAIKATVLEDYRNQWGWLIMSLLMVGALIDIAIAGSMLYWLHRQRAKVFKRATDLIDKIVQYTICTALLPSLTAIVMVITFNVDTNAMIWLAIYASLAKLYSNSVLASLNSRKTLRSTLSQQTSSIEPSSRVSRTAPRGQMVISVEMKSTVTHDGGDLPGDISRRPEKSPMLEERHPNSPLGTPKSGWSDTHRIV
ncbi:hypothetical protein CC1G_05327 [Coprinopsis cinerea okayama7|uniref:DUF6534 domain-containing protein n=1 Tax=Coprinopsis cinerea (strain Okayama-7 / 130 / ATCC MYA-4618 / FGSC 9003) TaxID=240176 RepID=A8NPP1_COPC7|nr:hypothetical protein CC1G_05327 [Coprinopsis cinerea okayama7\|eukprot:XP_001835365.1 hypothetical protein CC1G_05327 [Coprinopsis cinerea okayama7\